MHHRKAPPTGRAGSGCGTHDALGCNRQSGGSHRHGESCPRREATPGKVHQGVWELQNAPIRQEPPAVLQLPEVWPHGQDMLEGLPDISVLCWKPPFQPVQRGQAGHPEVCQLWRGTRHHQPGVFQKANLGQQSQCSTATAPTKNAWTKKFVPTMEDFPQTLTAVRAPPTLKHTVEVARPQVARPKPVATKTVVPDQRRQTPNVPRPVQRTVESQRCGVALKSPSPPQEEELEAITIALDGATALLRRVSTRKRHLIPALRKMIEAALDALKTLSA